MRLKEIILGVLVAVLVVLLAHSCRSIDAADTSGVPAAATNQSVVQPNQTPEATSAAPTPVVDHGKTDSTLAEDAASQALTAMWSWQPAVDTSTADGLVRARPWFSDTLVAATLTTTTPERRIGWQWTQWRSQGARVAAEVVIGCSGCPADEPDRISRVATITQTAIKPDGTSEAGDTITMWVTMTREPTGWRVNELHY